MGTSDGACSGGMDGLPSTCAHLHLVQLMYSYEPRLAHSASEPLGVIMDTTNRLLHLQAVLEQQGIPRKCVLKMEFTC